MTRAVGGQQEGVDGYLPVGDGNLKHARRTVRTLSEQWPVASGGIAKCNKASSCHQQRSPALHLAFDILVRWWPGIW
jgi:hypothetical protein